MDNQYIHISNKTVKASITGGNGTLEFVENSFGVIYFTHHLYYGPNFYVTRYNISDKSEL